MKLERANILGDSGYFSGFGYSKTKVYKLLAGKYKVSSYRIKALLEPGYLYKKRMAMSCLRFKRKQINEGNLYKELFTRWEALRWCRKNIGYYLDKDWDGLCYYLTTPDFKERRVIRLESVRAWSKPSFISDFQSEMIRCVDVKYYSFVDFSQSYMKVFEESLSQDKTLFSSFRSVYDINPSAVKVVFRKFDTTPVVSRLRIPFFEFNHLKFKECLHLHFINLYSEFRAAVNKIKMKDLFVVKNPKIEISLFKGFIIFIMYFVILTEKGKKRCLLEKSG